VRGLASSAVWSPRYDAIERFEQHVADGGTAIVKCYLHISRAEFAERQLARLEDPTKHWKYNPGDLDVYGLWDDYLEAYGDALARCNPDHAPWYVIPADRKWYRNWAVTKLLIEALGEMGLEWPKPDLDVEAERARVQALGEQVDQA
jgi:polyphosphate kinase 2 (PPK2 family)